MKITNKIIILLAYIFLVYIYNISNLFAAPFVYPPSFNPTKSNSPQYPVLLPDILSELSLEIIPKLVPGASQDALQDAFAPNVFSALSIKILSELSRGVVSTIQKDPTPELGNLFPKCATPSRNQTESNSPQYTALLPDTLSKLSLEILSELSPDAFSPDAFSSDAFSELSLKIRSELSQGVISTIQKVPTTELGNLSPKCE